MTEPQRQLDERLSQEEAQRLALQAIGFLEKKDDHAAFDALWTIAKWGKGTGRPDDTFINIQARRGLPTVVVVVYTVIVLSLGLLLGVFLQ